MNVIDFVENKETSEFYPTPKNVVERMLEKINFKMVKSILEPSAGKGDILSELAKRLTIEYHTDVEVDCIEIDKNLRAILKDRFSDESEKRLRDNRGSLIRQYGTYERYDYSTDRYRYYDSKLSNMIDFPDDVQKQLKDMNDAEKSFFKNGIHIVHDDFLTYTSYKQYDLIIMNPPFHDGAKHLLKALELQKGGGQIVCLLNAETIRNPFTDTRKHLIETLNKYDADIEYIGNAFTDSERKTDVDVALIYVNIPYSEESGESIFDRLSKAKTYQEPSAEEAMELEVTDMIKAIVNRYKVEVESGIELIKTYRRMLPHLKSDFNNENSYSSSIIKLTDCSGHDLTVNKYVHDVRFKYWKTLLTNKKFVGKLTSKLQREYSERVASYADYDFSEFNIYTLLVEMNSQIKMGIEDEISVMYDKLTEEHSYFPECTKNRHLYTGWKTNKAWKIDKKCIIPCYGIFDSWNGKPRTYEAYSLLSDIERILNFFDGNMTEDIDLSSQIQFYFDRGVTKNVHCKFFDVAFYKKGTVHITFTCPELIERFNIYAAQSRNWLPPSYGKKSYADMSQDEQSVIDSFQGKNAYENILSKSDYYLASPVSNNNILKLDMNNY